MLRTTDGQADAHGDDLSILYGAGDRCPETAFTKSWKKIRNKNCFFLLGIFFV